MHINGVFSNAYQHGKYDTRDLKNRLSLKFPPVDTIADK